MKRSILRYIERVTEIATADASPVSLDVRTIVGDLFDHEVLEVLEDGLLLNGGSSGNVVLVPYRNICAISFDARHIILDDDDDS